MTHKISWLAFIALTMVVVVLLLSCSDDDPPVGPRPVKDYAIYFSDASYGDRYFRYHTGTGKVDTLTIPYSSYDGMAVSADGKLLYLSDNNKTVVLTTDSLEFVTEILSQGRIAVSPDNRLIAVLGPTTFILSTSDYSAVFTDTVTTYHGCFSVNSDRLYCVGGPGVVRFDLATEPVTTTTRVYTDIVLQVLPSVDERQWLVYRKLLSPLWTYDMIVYDQVNDTVVYNKVLQPGAGEFELTPDGRSCFVTNPGTLSPGPTPSQAVLVYDIDGTEVVDSIVTPSPVNGSMIPRLLAITPDGKTLIAAGARGQGEFSVIDVRTLTVVEHYYLGNTVDFWDVACQNGK